MLPRGRRRKPTDSGTENRPPAACSPETPPVRVKRWGKSPPASVATRRLAKPRPVQGEQVPLRRPAEEPGSCRDGWSSSTESGLYGLLKENPAICRVFPLLGSRFLEKACITGASRKLIPSSG